MPKVRDEAEGRGAREGPLLPGARSALPKSWSGKVAGRQAPGRIALAVGQPSFPPPRARSQGFKNENGTSLAVQWLRFCASTTGDGGSVPGQGTKIPHATQGGQKKCFF